MSYNKGVGGKRQDFQLPSPVLKCRLLDAYVCNGYIFFIKVEDEIFS